MISQMNVVQNAARLAMDHRAARPGRRVTPARLHRGLLVSAALLGIALLAVVAYGAA